jgi:ParB family chromosome partitioning protein
VAKRVLGRGLDALLSDNVQEGVAAAGERIVEVALDAIEPNPQQPRKSIPEEQVRELAESIRERGVLQPVLLRRVAGGGFQLVAGERRCRAARAAGLATIPAVIRDVGDDEMLEVALIENIQREDLNEMEVAEALQQLIDDYGYTHGELATRTGKNRASVSNTLRLLHLTEFARAALRSGDISAGHARALAGLADEAAQASWCERITREGLSVRVLERLIAESPAPRSKRSRSRMVRREDSGILALRDRLQTALGTRVNIRRIGKGGRIEVEFYSTDDLDRLAEVLLQERP